MWDVLLDHGSWNVVMHPITTVALPGNQFGAVNHMILFRVIKSGRWSANLHALQNVALEMPLTALGTTPTVLRPLVAIPAHAMVSSEDAARARSHFGPRIIIMSGGVNLAILKEPLFSDEARGQVVTISYHLVITNGNVLKWKTSLVYKPFLQRYWENHGGLHVKDSQNKT